MELTLDQAWERCLKMWKRIIEDPQRLSTLEGITVVNLKRACMEEFWPDVEISNDCWFCEYDRLSREGSCRCCPGRLVDPSFNCQRTETHWLHQPQEFYQLLLRMHEVYLKAKAKSSLALTDANPKDGKANL